MLQGPRDKSKYETLSSQNSTPTDKSQANSGKI